MTSKSIENFLKSSIRGIVYGFLGSSVTGAAIILKMCDWNPEAVKGIPFLYMTVIVGVGVAAFALVMCIVMLLHWAFSPTEKEIVIK